MSTTGEKFEKAVSIMERLRAPGGCPWDREQTFDTIQRYTVEETYEVLEAIDTLDAKRETLLGGVSSKMPALLEAHKISAKAAQVGFDWPDIAGLFEKLDEETRELQSNLAELPAEALGAGRQNSPAVPEELRHRIEDEVGDLFFVLVNVARYLKVDPELALRRTNRKFRRRFGWLEDQLHRQGKKPGESTLEEMESLWQQAKRHEEKP